MCRLFRFLYLESLFSNLLRNCNYVNRDFRCKTTSPLYDFWCLTSTIKVSTKVHIKLPRIKTKPLTKNLHKTAKNCKQ